MNNISRLRYDDDYARLAAALIRDDHEDLSIELEAMLDIYADLSNARTLAVLRFISGGPDRFPYVMEIVSGSVAQAA